MSMIRAMSRDMSKAMNRIMEVVCSAGTADAIGIDGTAGTAGISGAVGIGRYALADRMTAYVADTHIMSKKNASITFPMGFGVPDHLSPA